MTKCLPWLVFVFTIVLSDPSSGGIWFMNMPMSEPRQDHTATLLFNGRVLVAGGQGPSSVLASAEVYDPAAGTWTGVSAMPVARLRHTAIMLTNGLVLVAGGQGPASVLASAEVYDPAAGTWTLEGP